MGYFGEFECENPKLLGSIIKSNLSFFSSLTDYKKFQENSQRIFTLGDKSIWRKDISYLQSMLSNVLLLLQTGLSLKYSLLNQDAEVTPISSLLWLKKKLFSNCVYFLIVHLSPRDLFNSVIERYLLNICFELVFILKWEMMHNLFWPIDL